MSPDVLPLPTPSPGDEASSPVDAFAPLDAAYAALHQGAVVIDRSARSRARFTGPKAAETLTGLVTNDVRALATGQGQYAAALTAKGKVIADVRIFARAEDLLVDVAAPAASSWWAMVRKFVNPRLAKYADISGETCDIGVFGPMAFQVVSRLTGLAADVLASLPEYAHLPSSSHGRDVTVARVPDLGVPGYDIIAGASERASLLADARTHSALPAAGELETLARIEAGRPAWGTDMNEETLAQEANLEELGAISFTKGCYTGQETVARIHFRGHVNRHLRGLRFDASAAVPLGAEVADEGERIVGDVRSTARSPRLGGIALAMVRREIPSGARVSIRWSGEGTEAEVVALPFEHPAQAG